MRNNILIFILGVVATLIIASSTITETITVPRKPTDTVIESHYYTADAISSMRKKVKEGYIIKAVTNGGEKAYIIVVMEKY